MAFETDERMREPGLKPFGEYLTTFPSRSGQVRADLFRTGKTVIAHVSFLTGLDLSVVTDPYVVDLWRYARENDLADRFKMVLSDS